MTETIKTAGKDAIEYIRSGSIYVEPRYAWLRPIVEKVITDNYYLRDVDDLVKNLFSESSTSSPLQVDDRPTKKEEVTPPIVARILEIQCLTNIGLVSRSKPITLNKTLNIFYGKNGTGKSSVYLGICKALGKVNKKVFPNIHGTSKLSSCQISVEDENNKPDTIEWNSTAENPELPVMIFDSLISNYIVEEDQANHFKIAHLKSQYFPFLHEMYLQVQKQLQIEQDKLNDKKQVQDALFSKNLPFIYQQGFILKDAIQTAELTDFEAEALKAYEAQIKLLGKASPEETIKNIKHVIGNLEKLLGVLADKQMDEKKATVWVLRIENSNIEILNKKINTYNEAKKNIETSSKLLDVIPKDWLQSKAWNEFVSKSIEFAKSLDKEISAKYLEKECLYCFQPLQTETSQKLIEAYKKLQDEHDSVLSKSLQELQRPLPIIEERIKSINGWGEILTAINSELHYIDQKESISIQAIKIMTFFELLVSGIKNLTKIENDVEGLQECQTALKVLAGIYTNFFEKVTNLELALKTRETEIKDLTAKAKPLLERRQIFENKESLLDYVKTTELAIAVSQKIADISAIKQATSALESKFSEEAPLAAFREQLKAEYEDLGFKTPDNWRIKSATKSGVNKRVYNLGDRKLSEIFSEGERKIHALADFFAKGQIDKYEGVYVFDDPVNSLDENYMEAVKDRILKLITNGHQVIVFTHNLVFLNQLIDPSKDKVHLLSKSGQSIFIEGVKLDEETLKGKLQIIESEIKEITEASAKGQAVKNHKIKGVYDLMSGYLEDYFEKVLLKNVISRFRPNIRMGNIDHLKDYNHDKSKDLSTFYQHVSRCVNRHSQPTGVSIPDIENLKTDYAKLGAFSRN